MMMLNDGFLPSDDQMRHTGNKMMQAYIWHVCQWWPVIPGNNQMMPNFTYDVKWCLIFWLPETIFIKSNPWSCLCHTCQLLKLLTSHNLMTTLHWLMIFFSLSDERIVHIEDQNQECHFICQWMTSCHWWQVLWNGPQKLSILYFQLWKLMTSHKLMTTWC